MQCRINVLCELYRRMHFKIKPQRRKEWKRKRGSVSAPWAGAYTITLLVMVDRVKGGRSATPPLPHPQQAGLSLSSWLNVGQKVAIASLFVLACLRSKPWRKERIERVANDRPRGFKGLVAVSHSFCLFLYFITFIQSKHPITFIQYIRRGLSPSLHRLLLSGKDLPVVPSRESNSGLPSSKPTRYQLSHAAP